MRDGEINTIILAFYFNFCYLANKCVCSIFYTLILAFFVHFCNLVGSFTVIWQIDYFFGRKDLFGWQFWQFSQGTNVTLVYWCFGNFHWCIGALAIFMRYKCYIGALVHWFGCQLYSNLANFYISLICWLVFIWLAT